MSKTTTLAFAAALIFASAGHAADNHAGHGQSHGSAHAAATGGGQSGAEYVEGEVRRIDKAGSKLTIKHGPIRNLDMPPMTMDFAVRDPAMLEQLSRGARIRFTAEEIDGRLTVTGIESR